MGATFVYDRVTRQDFPTAEAIQAHCVEVIAQALYDYGHAGYTGTFAEANGVSLTRRIFPTKDLAIDWLGDHCEKWGPILIVQAPGVWIYGALCST